MLHEERQIVRGNDAGKHLRAFSLQQNTHGRPGPIQLRSSKTTVAGGKHGGFSAVEGRDTHACPAYLADLFGGMGGGRTRMRE